MEFGEWLYEMEKSTKVVDPVIDYSLRSVGPYGPEADSQVPSSDKYLYYDVEYPYVGFVLDIFAGNDF